jgi:glycosyltransferase involved in cell wall biosynthesis
MLLKKTSQLTDFRTMRVLHIVPSLLPESGGPSRIVPELCRALAATGTQVTLFSTHLPAQGLTIDPTREPYEVVLFPSADGSLKGARQIYEEIGRRSRDFDVIHITSLWNLGVTWAAAAARKAKIPYVIAPMGMLSDTCLRQSNYSLKRAYSWIYDRRTVEGAARLHLANPDELRSLQTGWFRYPIHFFARNVTNVSPVTRTGSFKKRFPELSNHRTMLFMGRLHAIKGLDLQLRALELLVKKYPDLLWVLVGPDDGEWRHVQGLASKTGLDAHVKWLGPLTGDERFSGLADADVVVQTSLYECQSMTVNEALAVGVPVVVTDSVNYSEVQSTGAGFVVKRDPQELAQAIESIIESPDGGSAMRDAGRRFARAELGSLRICQIVKAAYAEVLDASISQQILHNDWRDIPQPSTRARGGSKA